ncbi:helix-turn-helix domain-containing protein [Virgibacillus sp. M23]|uniref:helix-turn-helix domain-containing protein n=1 Tax=Virgibacillus sp. M23 TaxID=3079030 RepID=UPI002A90D4B2|nr:helix-turn-helix domain-containing protein [Virgibacillus sp. M23]MDY7043669.1 helix-turn-helix domain-containing protein [Virgibacillus sp. M23]
MATNEFNSKLYEDYNDSKYAHYRNVHTGEYENQYVKNSKTGSRLKPIVKKIKVSFDEIKALNLDTYGDVVPLIDTEDFTIISNYLLDFWGAVIGSDAVNVYLHLKRYAYGKKDYCYPDIETIAMKMKKTKNTVKKYLDILEEYNFIAVFHRKDTTNNNKDVSPLFKIRRNIPMITQQMYNEFPYKLQRLHDNFMRQFEGVKLATNMIKVENDIERILTNGEIINNKETRDKINKMIKEHEYSEVILSNLDKDEYQNSKYFNSIIYEKVSKPSYESFFKSNVYLYHSNNKVLQIILPNEFAKEGVRNNYIEHIKKWAVEESTFDNIVSDFKIDFTMSEDYIKNVILSRG